MEQNQNKMLIYVLSAVVAVLLIGLVAYVVISSNNNSEEIAKAEELGRLKAEKEAAEKELESIRQSTLEDSIAASTKVSDRIMGRINDADGWTNVRSGASQKSSIVAKVYDGQTFYYTPVAGSKWSKFYWDATSPQAGYIYTKLVLPASAPPTAPVDMRAKTSSYSSSTPSLKKYSVVVCSYPSRQQAVNLQNELANYYGESSSIHYSSQKKHYRVIVYTSNSRNDAEAYLSNIRYNYPDAWLLSK